MPDMETTRVQLGCLMRGEIVDWRNKLIGTVCLAP